MLLRWVLTLLQQYASINTWAARLHASRSQKVSVDKHRTHTHTQWRSRGNNSVHLASSSRMLFYCNHQFVNAATLLTWVCARACVYVCMCVCLCRISCQDSDLAEAARDLRALLRLLGHVTQRDITHTDTGDTHDSEGRLAAATAANAHSLQSSLDTAQVSVSVYSCINTPAATVVLIASQVNTRVPSVTHTLLVLCCPAT